MLAAESRDPMAFGEWDEAYLDIIGNQIALGIDRVMEADEHASTTEEHRTRPWERCPILDRARDEENGR